MLIKLNGTSGTICIKSFTKIQVSNIHGLSLIYEVGYRVIEGDQVSQAGPAFHKSMLTECDHLIIPYVSRDAIEDDLLHDFS